MLEWLIACLSLPDQLYLTTTMSNSPVLRKNSVPIWKPDRPKGQALTFICVYVHPCLTRAVGDVEFESWWR
jgi:hypothetical protein